MIMKSTKFLKKNSSILKTVAFFQRIEKQKHLQ